MTAKLLYSYALKLKSEKLYTTILKYLCLILKVGNIIFISNNNYILYSIYLANISSIGHFILRSRFEL